MQKTPFHAVGLIRRSSISYVRHVLTLNQRRQPVVSLADAAAVDQVDGIVLDRCIDPEAGGGWFEERHALIRDDLPAQVSFTSGTEGKPKAIVLSHANLADASERLIEEMALTSEVREYIGVPVTHSFGMARARVVSAVGGRSYLPKRGFDPHELARMLAAGEVNSLAAVPTLLRLLLQRPEVVGTAGEKLRWMEIGSQYMSAAEKLAIRKLFPKARIVQHYGLTEASRSTFLQVSEASESELETVGRPVGKTEIDISPAGLIRIRGPHVAKWRIEDGRFVPLTGPDGWFVTNDRGHLDNGTLYFDGRADDLINSGGCKVNPDQLEAQIGKALGQTGKVVVAKVPDAVRGEGILVVTDEQGLDVPRVRAAAVEALKAMGLEVGDAMHVRAVASIPRTATGKPMRRVLADEYLAQVAAQPKPRPAEPVGNSPADVLAFFRQFFPGREIDRDASFESLGGDSLGYIQFSMSYEDRFGPLPSGWESLSVAQLQAQSSSGGKRGWPRLESATLTRAFFMICIVALHLATFEYSKNWGAAYFLYLLAGYSLMRFQWPEIDRTGNVATLLGTVVRIAIPTVLAVVFMQFWARRFEPLPLLLVSNFFDPSAYKVVYYYFGEMYMQLVLMMAALFSFGRVREAFRHRPMTSCTALIAVAMLMSAASEWVWDTTFIYHRTPLWYFWTVACGMLVASALPRGLQSRLTAMTIVTVAVLMHHGFTSASYYICGGTAMLLFWPEIAVPAVVKRVVGEIAGASMFMYLSHFQVESLVKRLCHGPQPWLALFAAIGVGIVLARTYYWLENRVSGFLRGRSADPAVGRAA